MFEKILSVPTDHRVSISSSSMHVLNDPLYWMIIEDENQKWNFKSRKVEVGKSEKYISQKMENGKVEKFKSENQKNI